MVRLRHMCGDGGGVWCGVCVQGLRVGEDDYPSSTDSECESQKSEELSSPLSNGKPR